MLKQVQHDGSGTSGQRVRFQPVADIPASGYEALMVTVRFSNEMDQPLEFMVEPWGAVELIAPGSHFAIHYPTPDGREDTSYAEYHAGMIRFWCEGDTYEIDVDGQRIET